MLLGRRWANFAARLGVRLRNDRLGPLGEEFKHPDFLFLLDGSCNPFCLAGLALESFDEVLPCPGAVLFLGV